MKKVLASRPDIIDKLIPKTFSFGCRRPTPGPGYLEALCNPKVEVFLSEMQEMTEAGFIDHEGKEHEVDVFICVRDITQMLGACSDRCYLTGYRLRRELCTTLPDHIPWCESSGQMEGERRESIANLLFLDVV